MDNKDKLDYKKINKCVSTYDRLGKILITLVTILIVIGIIYILNKLNVLGIIGDFLKLLIPLFAGIVISWLLNPLIDKMSKHIPRILACIITYIIVIGIIALIFYLIIPGIVEEGSSLLKNISKYIKEINKFIKNTFKNNDDAKDKIITFINSTYKSVSKSAGTKIINGTVSAISFIAKAVLTLMISFYLSYDYHKLNKGLKKYIPDRYMNGFNDLSKRINTSLRSYVNGVLMVMLFVFITQSIGFTLAGLNSPLVFALFCALTDIIPYFGPWIGAIPALVMAAVIGPWTFLFTCISIVVCQTLENNFYQPLIMGHSMSLHPVTIMLGLVIFGHFFGAIGMIIATPVIATIKIILGFVNEKVDFYGKIKNYKRKNA